MKKKLLVSIMFGLLVLGFYSPAYAANRIINPGFEDGLNDWSDLFGFPSDIDAIQHRGGAYSASKEVALLSNIDPYWSQLYQEVAYAPGERLYARAYIKTAFSPEATARAGLMVQFMDNADNVLGASLSSATVGGQVGWRLAEVASNAAPAGTTKARASLYLWAAAGDTISYLNGRVYFDDVLLDKINKVPAMQKTLLNRAFENGLNDWLELYGAPAILQVLSKGGVVYSGGYAVSKKVAAVTQQDYWSQLYQDVACQAGQEVTASLTVKTTFNIIAKAQAGLQLEFFNSTGQKLASVVKKIGSQKAWRKLAITVLSAPAGTYKVRMSAFVYAPKGDQPSLSGAAFFDLAALSIVTPTTLTASGGEPIVSDTPAPNPAGAEVE